MNQPYQQYLASVAGSFDFDAVLAKHKALFGDARMEGEEGGAPVVAEPGATGAVPTPPTDPGFPAETPVKDMTVDQQAAYWRHQAQKHEKEWKSWSKVHDLTPDQLQALREKADQHDALERELMSDKDKAILEAREAASSETTAKFAEKLVKAEFKSAAAGRLDAECLNNVLGPLDLTKFLDKNGDVDEAKVATYVDSIAPAATPPARRGPTASGLGATPHTPGERGAQGRAMAEKRFGKASA